MSVLNKIIKNIRSNSPLGNKFSVPIEVEKAEKIFYINYLNPGMTVFDVGANIGELSLLFSRLVGSEGQVHAFEASEGTFNKLTKICQLANRQQIILNQKAVSEKHEILQLYVYDDLHSTLNSLADRPLKNYGIDIQPISTEKVEAVTIDQYCHEHNIDNIDLLKIDVEGAEYQVLRGAEQMLKEQRICCCVFEFGQTTFDMGNNPDELESYLKAANYTVTNVVEKDPIFPGRSDVSTARFSIHIARPCK
ncbi:FkbM family methyltransferase [Acaryochloris sp. IP29b_bin.148]|uniref:FkbM family methyltransferase n=1 Tax=Acaryochloris sp. IP29b_bin.148 TaxID=2969218 RepID=UPI002639CA48|nr:FkbM family methyltransferase [Acaryochloris sp. IP29b_bin.148]